MNQNLSVIELDESPFKLIIERIKCCFKVLTQKKVIVTVYDEDKKEFYTDFFELDKSEVAINAKLTLMMLSQEQDLESKMYEKVNEVLSVSKI